MKTYSHLKISVILLIFGILTSCASQKTVMNQADEIFTSVVKSMQAIQQADDQKFEEIKAFLVTAKSAEIETKEIQNAEKLLESTQKKQLDLKKMKSKEIDNYDEMTENLIFQLEKIQELKPKNEALKNQFDKIQDIDNEDLTRRIQHDRTVTLWNKLMKKSSKKLQKSKKYKKAQVFPVFTIKT